ncbi:XdhC family protein [Leptolyngbya ohadii]|uniref:XdhC family protein n=1 Tax=Leptolyngbya ohadii TaxID=1962290 RepID=UPI000B59ADFC|nr:XdhC family protein [Leptolyngbya ohadii]
MSLECFRQLAQLLPDTPAVLATVISVRGSVPREAGAKMIICDDRTYFTIGGRTLANGQTPIAIRRQTRFFENRSRKSSIASNPTPTFTLP